ncbi:MAG: HupE/UreJ family protein [Bacteroidetes bacterium]|nr:HupE/UreJ family protein [Bacteroidota bacterium]
MRKYFTITTKQCLGILILLAIMPSVSAHAIITDLEKMSTAATAWLYVKLGYEHIIPLGFDHILFVCSLCLLQPSLKNVLLQASVFTVAHTVTLGLSMYKIISLPSAIVEPLIALSILYVALENIFTEKIKPARFTVVFLFGLIHGMGFASALSQLGLPQQSYFSSLLLFNVGVELGQATIILALYLLLIRWWSHKPGYRKQLVIPASVLIGIVAAYWMVQRITA